MRKGVADGLQRSTASSSGSFLLGLKGCGMSAHAPTIGTVNKNRRMAGWVLLIAAGLPIAGILTAGLRQTDVAPGLVDWLFVVAIALITAATYGLAVPRVQRLEKSRALKVALGMAVVALALVPVAFWTMLPLIIGSAAAWIAYTVSEGARRTALAWTVLTIGCLAAALSAVGYVVSSFIEVPTL